MEEDELFAKGTKFSSFVELESTVKRFEEENFVQLYVRDSRSIASTLKITPNRKIDEKLKYSHLVYACIAGGKKFKSRSKGARPNSRTFQNDCPMEIKISASNDGSYLQVTNVKKEHNHVCNEALFIHLPRRRKLDDHIKEEAAKLLNMKCNKKVLQNHLQNISGQVVTARDITNIGARVKKDKLGLKNNLEKIVGNLKKNHDASVEVLADEEDNLLGIYYQDKAMKSAYVSFPEVMFVDVTYNLNELSMPLYVLLGEDGNGESEIFAVLLVSNEQATTIQKMVQIFKKHNPNWQETLTVMSDKDFTQREVFKKEFPNVKLLIYLLDVQRSLRREVTTEKMGITAEERNLCLEIMQKMTYAKNIREYNNLHQNLVATNIVSVIEYFEKNWDPISDQWVEGLKSENVTFLNQTNNRVESLNQKIKDVCSSHASLDDFFDELLVVIQSMRIARDHRTVTFLQKRPVSLFGENTAEAKYTKTLTPYASNLVLKQMQLLDKVNVENVLDKSHFLIDSLSGKLKVSANTCQCSFWNAMMLPCHHVFAVRKALGIDAFESSLFAKRWTVDYYRSKHHQTYGSMAVINIQDKSNTTKNLSQNQKYRKAFNLCQQLSSLVSESPMQQFNQRLDVLQLIHKSWQQGEEIMVNNFNTDRDGLANSDQVLRQEIDSPQVDLQERELQVADNEPNNSQQLAELRQIKLPTKVLKRDFPREAGLTNIGIPQKKQKTGQSKRPVLFTNKHPRDKDKVMLSWSISDDDTTACFEWSGAG